MALTEYGKAVRKARIDAGVSLNEMSKAMGTSAAFLSGTETGRKKIPDSLVEQTDTYFRALGHPIDNLRALADVANEFIPLNGIPPHQQLAIAGFARRTWDEDQIESFKQLLGMSMKG